MSFHNFCNKRIIWESQTAQIWHIIGCFLFAGASLWMIDELSTLAFWVNIVFFGGSGLLMLIRLLNPAHLFVTPGSTLAEQIFAEQIRKKSTDLGLFTYDQTGFTLRRQSTEVYCRWADIETVWGYITYFTDDRAAWQEIGIEITSKDNIFVTVTNNIPGWQLFRIKLLENLPPVPAGWAEDITALAPSAHRVLLFQKHPPS